MLFLGLIFFLMITAILIENNFPYEHWHRALKIIFRTIIVLPLIIYVLTSSSLNLYSILIAIALLGCVISDILLLYNFTNGCMGFILVHLLNLINFSLNIKSFNGGLIIYLILFIIAVVYFYFEILKNKDYKILIYLVLLISTFWVSSFIGIICSIGYLLFVLCDVEVIYVEYVKEFKWYQQINHLLYYGGLILLSVSTTIRI